MSLMDDIVDLIHDEGPHTLEQLHGHFPGWVEKQIANALTRACQQQKLHNIARPGRVGVYAFGSDPKWLPSPLPANSIWQHAERCAPTRYELPVFLVRAV